MPRITRFDVLRILGFVIGFGAMTTPQVVAAVLSPYGLSPSQVTHVVAVLGSVVTLATLVANVLKNPSTPDGLHRVFSSDPSPTPDSLTTTAQKGSP